MSIPKLRSKNIGIEFIEEDGIYIPAIVYRKGKQWLRPLEAESFFILQMEKESFPLDIQSVKRTDKEISYSGSISNDEFQCKMTGSFEILQGNVETIKTKVKIKVSAKPAVKK